MNFTQVVGRVFWNFNIYTEIVLIIESFSIKISKDSADHLIKFM
jgi:hypothetical protein